MADSIKCSFHCNRSQCTVALCNNQVYARQLCVRHGGKKVCETPGCITHACGGGHCLRHGGIARKRYCSVEGCSRQAHKNQRCVRHGGGRYCQTPQCSSHARFGGFCLQHNVDLEPIQHVNSSFKEPANYVRMLDPIDSAILECLATYSVHATDSSSFAWSCSSNINAPSRDRFPIL
ncbi:hypothetical protein H310_12356 [Aphanomyces invadans]|uniref:Uncharacterized protein n=1 Tax=Aphanomyces invadans TaxID=157072 RepID=A0A024TKC2_9STRA|nr:hypothetical protein H310_12356 [Aphanomyces invadans]ETV93792.1 hypothetical protein H310_12356 [Aphanomyces invadans]|eukprot:XP_008877601.1 hypothetical protein H310_12356 [Aphanomyces invadans]